MFLQPSLSRAAENIILSDTFQRAEAGTFLEIYEDSSNKLTVSDILTDRYADKFVRSAEANPNFGFTDTSYWVRFTLKNRSAADLKLFLEAAYPHLNRIELFRKINGRAETVGNEGDIYPFHKRSFNYRNFIFSLNIRGSETDTYYMRFSGECSKQISLTLWAPQKFSEMVIEENFALGIYYGIIIVMMLYNLFIFFFVRDSSYLYYVLYIFMYGLVQMAYNGMAFKYLWPAFPVWHNISLPFLIGSAIFCMLQFSRTFLRAKKHAPALEKTILGFMGVSLAVIILSFTDFYITAIKSAMVLMVIASLLIVTSAVIIMKRGYRPARFFVVSWVAFLTGMVLIALNKLNFLPSIFITEYAIQIGSAIEVTLLSVALADRINETNREKKAAQLEQIKAQEKYRFIVEETNDIIFSLDSAWNFITVNRAIRNQLNMPPSSLTGMNFLDLIYTGHNNDAVSRDIVKEKLELFAADMKPVSFKAEFRTQISSEPKEMNVRLEYLNIEGKTEILGKASGVEEDSLLKYFECEKQQFSFGNYLILAEDMTQRVTRNLAKFIPPADIMIIRMALREIIINAIEHGNLNISYEEKTEALMNNNYFNFIAERRSHPEYSGKKVNLVYSIKPDRAVFRISDEGDGFDYRGFLANKAAKANDEHLEHGRGLIMAFNVFDSIEFNKKGNQVLLVKFFGKENDLSANPPASA